MILYLLADRIYRDNLDKNNMAKSRPTPAVVGFKAPISLMSPIPPENLSLGDKREQEQGAEEEEGAFVLKEDKFSSRRKEQGSARSKAWLAPRL